MTTPLWTIDPATDHRRFSPAPARRRLDTVETARLAVATPRPTAEAGPNSGRVCALVDSALLVVSLAVAAVSGGAAGAMLDLVRQGVSQTVDQLAAWQISCAYGFASLASSNAGMPAVGR